MIMTRKQIIKRLTNAIKNGKFAFEKYYNRGMWYGLSIQVQNVFCSYGQCGYQVFVYKFDEIEPYHYIQNASNGGRFLPRLEHIATISHDWELNKTEVEYFN